MPILLVFLVVPLVELWLLTRFAIYIGWPITLSLVIVTAFLGVKLLKQQGSATLSRALQKWQQGSLPAEEILEGFLLVFSGALLLTPGFITDFIGFTLLIPPCRSAILRAIIRFGADRFFSTFIGARGQFYSVDIHKNRTQQGETIDGEVTSSTYSKKDNNAMQDEPKQLDKADSASEKKHT